MARTKLTAKKNAGQSTSSRAGRAKLAKIKKLLSATASGGPKKAHRYRPGYVILFGNNHW